MPDIATSGKQLWSRFGVPNTVTMPGRLPEQLGRMASEDPELWPALTARDRVTSISTDQSNPASRDVQVQLQYLKNDPLYDTVKPVQIVPEWLDLPKRSNVLLESGPSETIHDVRGREADFSLDGNGFQYVHAPTEFKEWSSQPAIGKMHLPELESLLRKEVDGADEIMFYDARLRQETDTGVKVRGLSFKPYARQVHTDNTESSVISKVHNLTDMKADYYLQGRVRIVNIWRPIKHPVYDCGLAVADGSKLRDDDVIECNRVRRDTGAFWDTMGVVKHREGFEWHYMSRQDEADVLLFKNYDSATDIPARLCLHTAFDMPSTDIPPNSPTRESIEVRAMVFTWPTGIHRPILFGGLEHPLARQLEQESLPLIDEEHSITDRLRTDIDEAAEMKDAMLLLRKHEIRRVKLLNEDLRAELHDAKAETQRKENEIAFAGHELEMWSSNVTALQHQISLLKEQLAQRSGDWIEQIERLERDITNAKLQRPDSAHDEQVSPEAEPSRAEHERDALLRVINDQAHEIEKWKGEAMGRGNEAVSRCYQTWVDEAVRREREKDAFVLKAKDVEIERLRARVEALSPGR